MKNLSIDKFSKDNGEDREMLLRDGNISITFADSTKRQETETVG